MFNQNPTGSATGILTNGTVNTLYTIYETTLLQGFSDPDGDTLKFSGFWADSGELTALGNGQWSLNPDTDYTGSVTLDYILLDNKGGEIQGTLNFSILPPQAAPTGSVTILGTAQQYQTLTASNTLTDVNNIVSAINYQWFSGGNSVSNQNNYTLTQSDVGKNVSVTASYTDGFGKLESVSSSVTTVSNVNDSPTGSVSISGTAMQGQVLTAANTLADLDGLGTISYQWLSNGTVISGATASTYTLTNSEVGKAITVKANYTDLQKTAESVSSNATALVVAGQTAPTGNVTIDGTVAQNQTISANTNLVADVNGLGTFSYQWLSNGIAITGQTTQSYALTQSDVGKAISVKVSYTDGLGKLESLTSSSVATVANVNDLPTGIVSISGETVQRQTLTASNTLQDIDGLGAISYQWLKNGVAITGATLSSYTLTASDVNTAISVQANYTDLQGTLENVTSDATTLILASQTAPTGSVSIDGVDGVDGVAVQNQIVMANTSTLADLNGLGELNYQWLNNNTVIENQTMQSYTLSQSDVGKKVSVKVSYTDGLGKLESITSSAITVTNVNDLPTGSVILSGDMIQGQVLTANNDIEDLDGLGAINYQWLVDGKEIKDKTQETYVLTQADVGKTIGVKASYKDGFNKLESVSSSKSNITVENVNDPPTGNLLILGMPVQGQVLKVSNTLTDLDGLGVIGYQWLSDGNEILEANQNSYTLTATDIGQPISVKASYTDLQGTEESVTSIPTAQISEQTNYPPTGNVVISGKPEQNQTLTVSNTLNDKNTIVSEIAYQWSRDGVSVDSDSPTTYVLTQDDVDKTISVTASYYDGLNKFETKNSSVVKIINLNDAPTGSVVISNDTPQQGNTLTVNNDLNDIDGLGAISYQWLRNGLSIPNATKNTYTLTALDVDKVISVKASYVDGFKKWESVVSNATDSVFAEGNVPPVGKVTIKGKAEQNQTLTASNNLTDENGLGVIKYQWLSDDIEITGKTKATYILTDADVGKAISVQASYIDGLNKFESVTSNSVLVKAMNNLPTGSVSILGETKVGKVLTVQSTLKDSDGLGGFNYQWLSAGKAILGATTATYTPVQADTGKKISVKVSYTDGLNTLESKTSAETTDIKAAITINGLTKSGTSSNNKIVGAERNDKLLGLAGADTLLGYAGDDLLDGGNGNDSIDAGNGNDILLGGDGNDILLAGSGNDSLDGGKGDDKLTGDKGNDTLQGGVGADNMAGGVSDDYYFVDNKKDVVTEVKAAGTDTIESTLTYTLGTNVENLILAGILDNSGTGNELNNKITGNVGDNKLNGGAGNDTLVGGAGADELNGGLGKDALIGGNDDDIYYMNNTEDTITETATGGEKDEIIASVSFELSNSNVEILTLSGVKAINGTGDEFNNLIQEIDGGKVANNLNGKAGDDTINGEGGNDSLEGGEGNDVIDGGDGNDVVIFNGVLEDYQISKNQDVSGDFTVLYTGDNPDINEGEDNLTNVEILAFNGNSYTINELVLNGVIA